MKKELKEKIENVLATASIETTAFKMAEFLMDDKVGTKEAYEDIAYRYLNGSDEVRATIDAVLIILLSKNFEEITDEIAAYNEEFLQTKENVSEKLFGKGGAIIDSAKEV